MTGGLIQNRTEAEVPSEGLWEKADLNRTTQNMRRVTSKSVLHTDILRAPYGWRGREDKTVE